MHIYIYIYIYITHTLAYDPLAAWIHQGKIILAERNTKARDMLGSGKKPDPVEIQCCIAAETDSSRFQCRATHWYHIPQFLA